MKITKLAIFFISFFFASNVISQTNTNVHFFPLHVGDTWQYLQRSFYNSDSSRIDSSYKTFQITHTKIINSKKYFIMAESDSDESIAFRIDSSNATLWISYGETECAVDSLSMNKGDTSYTISCGTGKTCIQDTTEFVLEEVRRVKTFAPLNFLTKQFSQTIYYSYAEGLGLVYSISTDIGLEADRIEQKLIYAKIENIEFGNKHSPKINPDINFYPINIGDIWIYSVTKTVDGNSTFYVDSSMVIGTEIIGGKKYFLIDNVFSGIQRLRIDSSTATIWKYNDGNDIIVDSLSCSKGDLWSGGFECIKDTTINSFNDLRRVKKIRNNTVVSSGSLIFEKELTEGIGPSNIVKIEYDITSVVYSANLQHAIINGIEYEKDKNNLSFFPLQIGNKWVYQTIGSNYDITQPSTFSVIRVTEVIGDTITSSGQKYYKITDRFDQYWLRQDSATSSVYQSYCLDDENECLIIKFPNSFQEEYSICYSSVNGMINSDTLIWNESRKTKKFSYLSISEISEVFAEGIGSIKKENEFDFGYSTTSLLGCVINGTLYGDTTTTGSNDTEPEKISFSLLQNYPNPFNPSTTIKYSIPTVEANTNVLLKVYDILGREVATLVNMKQKPGNYEVIFDAGNLTSGIYFYQLRSGEFSDTKKLLLLK